VLEALEATLKEKGLKARIELVLIQNEEEARTKCFLGSPTLQVEGTDLEPSARSLKAFGLG
jgi:hypothetical protein